MIGAQILRQPRLVGACVAILSLACAARAVDAQASTPTGAARAALDPIVADLVKLAGEGRVDQMLEKIGPVPDNERDIAEKTREGLINLYANAGKYSGFDIAGIKALTPRFQVEYVLVYFEKRPVLFEFGFYQVDGKWRPQTIYVEPDFKALLDAMPLQK